MATYRQHYESEQDPITYPPVNKTQSSKMINNWKDVDLTPEAAVDFVKRNYPNAYFDDLAQPVNNLVTRDAHLNHRGVFYFNNHKQFNKLAKYYYSFVAEHPKTMKSQDTLFGCTRQYIYLTVIMVLFLTVGYIFGRTPFMSDVAVEKFSLGPLFRKKKKVKKKQKKPKRPKVPKRPKRTVDSDSDSDSEDHTMIPVVDYAAANKKLTDSDDIFQTLLNTTANTQVMFSRMLTDDKKYISTKHIKHGDVMLSDFLDRSPFSMFGGIKKK